VTILTKTFWQYAGERALKTVIQTFLAVFTTASVSNLFDGSLVPVAGSAIIAGVISVLTSIVAVLPAQPDLSGATASASAPATTATPTATWNPNN